MKCWMEHENYRNVIEKSIQKSRTKSYNLFNTLKNLEYDFIAWNKSEFGNIFKNISNILENIENENKKTYSLEMKVKRLTSYKMSWLIGMRSKNLTGDNM